MFPKLKARNFYSPLTLTGGAYLCTGIGLCALGLVRGELAAGLIGLLILAYAAISLLFCLLGVPAWNKTRLCLVQRHTTTFSLNVLTIPSPAIRLLCGSRMHLEFKLAYRNDKEASWILSHPVTIQEDTVTVPCPGRGRYLPGKRYLELHDFALFFKIRLSKPAKENLDPVIFPAIPEKNAALSFPSGISGKTTGHSTFERSENLFETRTYMPGDDPRKINWKVYAHSGALSIREGELLPPPANELYCFFNTRITGPINKKGHAFFSLLVNRSASFLLEQLHNNKTVILILPGNDNKPETRRFEPSGTTTPENLVEALALPVMSPLTPSCKEYLHSVPSGARVVVFSLPDTAFSLPSLASAFYYFGPYLGETPKSSFDTRLHRLLYTTKRTQTTPAEYLPSGFQHILNRFSREGLHAHIM